MPGFWERGWAVMWKEEFDSAVKEGERCDGVCAGVGVWD